MMHGLGDRHGVWMHTCVHTYLPCVSHLYMHSETTAYIAYMGLMGWIYVGLDFSLYTYSKPDIKHYMDNENLSFPICRVT